MRKIVINHLSISSVTDSLVIAREKMNNFAKTITLAIKLGCEKLIHSESNFKTNTLSQNYTVYSWIQDSSVDNDLRSLFAILYTKIPILTESDESEYSNTLLLEISYLDESLVFLTHAYEKQALIIGYSNENFPETSSISVLKHQIDLSGGIHSEQISLPYASSELHLFQNIDWIESPKLSFMFANDFSREIEQLLPYLSFCGGTIDAISDLQINSEIRNNVVSRLLQFNRFCADRVYQNQSLEYPFQVSPESQQTLAQFGKQREFVCADGVSRMFSLHTPVNPGAWRIHFFDDFRSKSFHVGYIGAHLPTSREH